MKAKAKVLIDLQKSWRNEEQDSVRVIAVRYQCRNVPVLSAVRVVRIFVVVDGETTIDSIRVADTWSDSKLVIDLVHEYERMVENHPCSYELPVQHESVKQDDIPF